MEDEEDEEDEDEDIFNGGSVWRIFEGADAIDLNTEGVECALDREVVVEDPVMRVGRNTFVNGAVARATRELEEVEGYKAMGLALASLGLARGITENESAVEERS